MMMRRPGVEPGSLAALGIRSPDDDDDDDEGDTGGGIRTRP
jgi:hypothetical protein